MKNSRRKMSVRCFLIIAIAAFTVSCSVNKIDSKEGFKKISDRFDSNETIRIDVTSANPLNTYATQTVLNQLMRNSGDNASRIDLLGDGHYLEFNSNRAVANLPFFGERRQNVGYNSSNDSGINFDEKPEDFKVDILEDRNKIEASFEASQGIEIFEVDVVIYGNGNAVIYISSSSRTRIEYEGIVVDKIE